MGSAGRSSFSASSLFGAVADFPVAVAEVYFSLRAPLPLLVESR
jgi:hypothetical protein